MNLTEARFNPLSPPLRSPQQRPQGHHAKSKYLAVSHGQTLRHQPDGPLGFTLQVGDAPTIAEQCGIDVCANFRCRDIAAGGQGAPLVPAFHAKYLASPDRYRAVVNVGGMANITLLEPGSPITGFDSGPGNVLMNAWTARHLKQPFDDEGKWAASGVVNEQVLAEMLGEGYFKQASPKSTGREMFDWHFIEAFRHKDSPENIQATLLELTARTICDELPAGVQDIYVCGGGASNTQLMKRIAVLSGIQVQTTDEIGLPADWLEAIAFAWLARALILGEPANEQPPFSPSPISPTTSSGTPRKKQIPSSRGFAALSRIPSAVHALAPLHSIRRPPLFCCAVSFRTSTPFLPLSDLPNNVLRDTTQKANT